MMAAVVRSKSVCWLVLAACCWQVGGVIESDEDSNEDWFKDLQPCIDGHCVQLHLCINDTIVQHGEGVIETALRFAVDLEKDPLEECEEFMLRCCKHLKKVGAASAITTTPTPVTEQPDDPEQQQIDEPPASCGTGYPQGYIYHVNDRSVAQYAEYPWQAGLYRNKDEGNEYICGGSLIDRQVVMTAAHCLRNFSDSSSGLIVRLGDWDAANENEPHKHKDFSVKKIIKHERFHPVNYRNNIALLVLSEPATLDKNINLICLPHPNDSFEEQRCTISGWGKDVKGKYQGVLKKVELPVIENRQCQTLLRKTVLGAVFQLHRGFMCAGGEADVDACKGDGGGPLMCASPDGHGLVQAGIIAWGIGCGEKDVPGVYVNVAKYVEWIQETMLNEGISKNPQPY